ncbi:serine carboxypeptidase-like 42 [Phoenix dactylifera]|uniref:Carboxypeptidase n=1 Tax=Phoenix dactylifera TaxID=42345 RepID=A0A8B9ATY5_PHODC|nr:serine carboxypeptidase-like 42 [Phoenix dactylifera]
MASHKLSCFLPSLMVLALSQSLLLLGAPLEHLVSELPGQPPVEFKQYSGYITVDEAKGTNFFYYFVEAEANASSLPINLWLNGGPGCSSVGGGAFSELGPFYPKPNGEGLRRNPFSWNKVANLLFLESPAGVGWSYCDKKRVGYNYDDWRVGWSPFPSSFFSLAPRELTKENLAFVRKWFQLFPEYTNHQLFLTGESYAGHYIPQLAWSMVMCNEFNFNGILIGNPLLNYGIDTSATYSFLWSHGVISDETFHGVSRWCDFRYGYMGGEGAILDEEKREGKKGGCTSFLASARNEMGSYINIYDVTADVCPPPILHQAILLHKLLEEQRRGSLGNPVLFLLCLFGFELIITINFGIASKHHGCKQMGVAGQKDATDVCIDHEITRYLNKPDVQKALHANLTSLPYPWEACSRIVNYNATNQLTDMIPTLARLVKKGLPVWIFSGDQDSVVPLTGTRSQIAKLAQQLKLKPKSPYQPWYAHGQVRSFYASYILNSSVPLDINDKYDVVGGWSETYGNGRLVYATVRDASHMVPYAQPERALVLFTRNAFVLSQSLLKPQASMFLSAQGLWEELTNFRPQQHNEYQFEEQVMQFLMGLDDSYSNIHGQILLMDPLPPVNKVFALVLPKERQREVTAMTQNFEAAAFANKSTYDKPVYNQVFI